MSEDNKIIKQYVCPACFAKELDVIVLKYDAKDHEYYCPKCCYVGQQENIESFFKMFTQEKYKLMNQ